MLKKLAHFWTRLVLDQGSNLGTGEVEQGLDVKVVGGFDEFKQKFLVDIDVLCLPWIYEFRHVSTWNGLLDLGWSDVFKVVTELEDLLNDLAMKFWKFNLFLVSNFHDVNENIIFCYVTVNLNNFSIFTNYLDFAFCHKFILLID